MSALTIFQPSARVVLEHPRRGRHYATMIGPVEHDERACKVRVDGNYVYPEWTVLAAWLSEPRGERDMVIGDLLNLQMLKEVIEVEFLGSLWTHGDSGMLTPYVCEASFGDGMHLLTISTINQRPNYHVVRVDSAWREARYGWHSYRDCEIAEHIDDVLTAIEEECGRAGDCLDDPCDNCHDTVCKCREDFSSDDAFPALDDENGCSWGHISWRWLMEAIGYQAMIDRLVEGRSD